MLSLLFQLLLFSKPSFEANLCNNLYNGTTKNFKDIVLGRCFYYINSLHKDNCEINSANLNCSLIWDEFYRVVVNKSPCQVSIKDFDQFVHLTSHPYSNEKSVFWSGTYKAVHQISRLKGDWTLEDTLSGYLLDGLSFCSDNKSDNFLTICPTDCVTRNNPFWNAVSKNYASKATGRVTAVLNGTRNSGALSNYSTFFNFELPSMNFKNINHFQVILLHSPEMPTYETCLMPKTLNTLRNILESNNVTYECIDDNFYLKNFLCIENQQIQNSPECQKLFSAFSKTSSVVPFWPASASIIALTAFNLLF